MELQYEHNIIGASPTILTAEQAFEKWAKCVWRLFCEHKIRQHPELTRDVHPYAIEKLDYE